jgi:hypothetical protein
MHSATITDIRHRLALGHSGVELARVYQVDAAVISKIKQGRYGDGCTDPEAMSDRLERVASPGSWVSDGYRRSLVASGSTVQSVYGPG